MCYVSWALGQESPASLDIWGMEDRGLYEIHVVTQHHCFCHSAEMVPKHKCVCLWRFLRVGLLSVDRVPFSNNGFNWPCNVGGC